MDGDGDGKIKVEETMIKVEDGLETEVQTNFSETKTSKGRKRSSNGILKVEKIETTNILKIEDVTTSGRRSLRRRT